MFATLALFIGLAFSPAKPACESFTRLDATTVTVCGGSVTHVSDDQGNSRDVGR
jgi:hypothetical protein